MKQVLSILSGVLLVLVLMATTEVFVPQDVQAQITVADDFKLAWNLDPYSDPVVFARGLGYTTPAFGGSRVLVDIDSDNDGKKEILFLTDETLSPAGPDPGSLDVMLYENTGDDTYEYVWHYSHVPSNSLPALAYGDVDGDGRMEIYFGIPTINDDPVDLFIFEADDAGVFPDTPTTTYEYRSDGTLDFRPAGIQLADVDGDGKTEVLTVSRTGGRRELVVMSLAGASLDAFATWNVEFEANETVLGGGGLYDLMVVDFDGDGLNEIWVNTWDLWSMTVFEATAPDTYVMQVDINQAFPLENDPGSFNAHDMYFQDYDGDSKMEAYFPMTDGKLYYLDDLADVSTLSPASINMVGTFGATSGPRPYESRGADVGDLDGDGLTDIIAANGRAETVSRVEYDGVGDRADSTSYSWTTLLDSQGGEQDYYYPLRIANDLDGDGRNEVVMTNRYADVQGQIFIAVIESTEMAVGVEDAEEIPDSYTLHQNYPNPFNPTTTIRFEIPVAAAVSVSVYNIMGQRVRTLVAGQLKEAGTHSVVWDGRDQSGQKVASGTYVYSLEYGNTRVAKSMVLLK